MNLPEIRIFMKNRKITISHNYSNFDAKMVVIIYLGLYFIFAMVNRKYKSETQAVWAASKQLANFLIGLCSRSRNRISRDWRLFNSLYYKLSLKITILGDNS